MIKRELKSYRGAYPSLTHYHYTDADALKQECKEFWLVPQWDTFLSATELKLTEVNKIKGAYKLPIDAQVKAPPGKFLYGLMQDGERLVLIEAIIDSSD